jgi:hypothetical protein
MGTVVDPIARCRNPLSGRDHCGVPNHGHNLAMTPHLGAQNAEAVLGIVVGDAFDQAPQNLVG